VNLVRNIILVALVLVLGVAVFLLLKTELLKSDIDGLEVISPNAVLVFESTDPVGIWNQLVSQPVWEKLNDFPALKEIESQLVFIDSMAGKSGNLYQNLKGQKFTLSVHPIGKEDYGFLFSITGKSNQFFDFVNSIEERVSDRGTLRTRNYSGVTVYESKAKESGREFSYAKYKNVWLGSYTSFLVEDGIRYAKSSELENFKDTFSHLYESKPEPPPSGILRLSGKGLAGFVGDITTTSNGQFSKSLARNLISANLVPGFTDESIDFQGEFFLDGQSTTFPSPAEDGKGLVFSNLISNRAAIISQYFIEGPKALKSIQNQAFDSRMTTKAEIDEDLDLSQFYDLLTGEMALVLEENLFSNSPNKVLILNCKDAEGVVGILKAFQLEINQNDGINLFMENYLGREIFMLDLEEFPAHIFEGNFTGFLRSYVTRINETVIIGNSLRNVKNLLDDVYNDNTWGKSLAQRKNLNILENNATFQVIINNDRFFNMLIRNSAPSWSSIFQKYSSLFRSFRLITLSVKEKNQFDLMVKIDLENVPSNGKLILTESRSVQFDKELIYGPAGLQNFNDKSTEFLVQDEEHVCHLVSEDGEVVFSFPLSEKIISPVYQIDYYKNGKLQLLFATPHRIYALDRYGNLLPDYPIDFIDGENIDLINLVDYDNNLNYRYFISDTRGDLYIYDQVGNLLEGWNPKNINWGALSTKPAHHRIPGKGDFMVSTHKNGVLGIFNRKGEPLVSGGINIGEALSTSYGLEEEVSEGLSRLVTVNDAGEVVKVNFNGELTYRNQLLRPDRDTRFKLINDQNFDEFLWVIEEYNKLTVLRPNEELLFEMNLPTEELDYQYFSFGSNNKIFAVLDRVQEFTYLYNSNGQLINQKPIDANPGIWIDFSGSDNTYTLMATHGKKLYEYKVPF
jgi:hypothetical protein